MGNHTNHLALSELHSCQAYLSRLFKALIELSSLEKSHEARKLGTLLVYKLKPFLATHALKDLDPDNEAIVEAQTLTQARDFVHLTTKALESLLKLNIWPPKKSCQIAAELINILYLQAHSLHKIVAQKTFLKVHLPRVAIGETKKLGPENSEPQPIPLFFIDSQKLLEFSNPSHDGGGLVESIEWQREKHYEQLIGEGHQAIANKKHTQALKVFERARNFNDCAEVLTLIAWVYGLMENREEAKSFCLKAIQLDPHYGPPYNDLGSYLLQENQLEESLKWFDLAKRSLNYQNREYPYINAGRAYMIKRNFSQALEEFSKALTLAPYNEELHHTTQKLKRIIERSEWDNLQKKTNTAEEQPPLF